MMIENTELNPRQPRHKLAKQIAASLNETEKTPFQTIERLIFVLGEERALALLAEANQVEADGGLMTDDGQRRRSLGGIFFKLAKEKTSGPERGRIFNTSPPKAKVKIQPLEWETVAKLAGELLAQNSPGKADKMKLTLIGRPGKVIEKENVVMTTLQSSKAPSLPNGLPAPPPSPTTYLIFIARKQWRKVNQAIETDPRDKLIVEGYPAFDARIGGGTMCLYAQNVTTTALQRARWAEKKGPA